MVFGIKLKNLSILEKPEITFHKKLRTNPYHPFKKIEKDGMTYYQLQMSDRRFWISVFMALATAVLIGVWCVLEKPGQYIIIPILIIIVWSVMAYESRGDRKCVLDTVNKTYSFIMHGHVRFTKPMHNVYIRLKAQKLGAGDVYYYVVFNGYQIHEQKLTSYSQNDKRLRILAKKLAENLNINYFDIKATSVDHIIRHRRPAESIMPDKSQILN